MKNDRVSVEYMRQSVRVDEQTGRLYWRERPASHFLTDVGHRWFLDYRAGGLADLGAYPLNGYRRVRIRIDGVQHTISAHRVVFALTHGRWPDLEVDHIDGARTNNRPSNLRELSHAENMRAMFARRRGMAMLAEAA